MNPEIEIVTLAPGQVRDRLAELAGLLIDCVDSGAAVGFLSPVTREEAETFWIDVAASSRIVVLAAVESGAIAGAVHLELATRPNAQHRAEVTRLMVHRRFRRRGIGRMLMQAVERAALEQGRMLLLLNTRRGDIAEHLYRELGYVEVGIVPRYALSSAGEMRDNVFLYRDLTAAAPLPRRDFPAPEGR